MLRKFKKFTLLSSEEKKLSLEAFAALGVMRTSILTLSFKRLTHSFDHAVKKEDMMALNDQEMDIALKVGQAITRAAAYTPWESTCLVQCLTAKNMLQKRGIPGVFYLGVMKDTDIKENMKAHAWSQCGDIIITGNRGHEDFIILSVFKWSKHRDIIN